MIDVEEDLRACASRKKELKTLSKKLVTDVNDAKTRIDEELQALQATGGADEFGDDSEAAHAVASSKIRCEARLPFGVRSAEAGADGAARTSTRDENMRRGLP